MPIYEFRCAKCGNIQEFLLTRSAEEIEMKCSECGEDDLVRVMSQTNYAMGSGKATPSTGCGGGDSCMSSTTRNCGSNSCSTLSLPGYARD